MRLKRAIAAVLGLAAVVTVVGASPSIAQGEDRSIKGVEREQGPKPLTTDGQSFLEINGAGQLVHWQRSGESYSGQLRGWGWQGTRAITSLDNQSFLEIKGDGRLSKWTWNGGTYVEAVVGSGWNNARLVTGIANNQFIEINNQGELVYWTFDGSNNLSRVLRGWGWGATKSITGLDPFVFFELKGDALNSLSWWVDTQEGLREFPEEVEPGQPQPDNRWMRLIAGTDSDHFTIVDTDGILVEYTLDPSDYVWKLAVRGSGWQGTRLIG
ncbi:hypothetical protein [Lentzea cavernae]|uniref:Tachylectin n=1 Tax=Lentzea cavernae TaxID=2020703 RepID=A0ABQ3MKD7_9PSEU|nr:hypothetical protein [Lentzea cavernae]GHH48031.1 hypothetical protein GCM10017774_53320 [Lentzea cavernae]